MGQYSWRRPDLFTRIIDILLFFVFDVAMSDHRTGISVARVLAVGSALTAVGGLGWVLVSPNLVAFVTTGVSTVAWGVSRYIEVNNVGGDVSFPDHDM